MKMSEKHVERLKQLNREEQQALQQHAMAAIARRRLQQQEEQALQQLETKRNATRLAMSEIARALGFDPDKDNLNINVDEGVIELAPPAAAQPPVTAPVAPVVPMPTQARRRAR